jgi:uncharacterized YigZ family protein
VNGQKDHRDTWRMPYALASPVHSDFIIRKSRFIGCVEPCDGREAALARVAQLRAEHPGATHVCWALMAGGHSAANDDGEPGGTAGRPMLEVLRHQDLAGVLATVVRYYGGIQLGAGGLVRAYTDAVAQALLQATKTPITTQLTLRCALPYAMEGWLRRALEQDAGALLDVNHGSEVVATFRLPEPQVAAFRDALTDASQGRVRWLAITPDAEVEVDPPMA